MTISSPGARFRAALKEESPLQIPGTINANHALLAKRAGFRAIYLSGGGVAAGSLGLPDLGITGLDDVLTDIRRITDVCDLPLLSDIDTGFGPSAFNIARTVRSLIKAGAAACHIEDQVGAKRWGHLFTEPELQPDGSLAFWQLSLTCESDDFKGWAGEETIVPDTATVTTVRLVPTENGWRVDALELPN